MDDLQWHENHKSIRFWQDTILLGTASHILDLLSVGNPVNSSTMHDTINIWRINQRNEENKGIGSLFCFEKGGSFQLITNFSTMFILAHS